MKAIKIGFRKWIFCIDTTNPAELTKLSEVIRKQFPKIKFMVTNK